MSGPVASSEWRKIRAQIDEMAARTRKLIENPDLGIEATQLHRGALMALNKLIEWGEPSPAEPVATEPLIY